MLRRKKRGFWARDRAVGVGGMAEKKETCILHIGAPKTGTTALQFGLANYDDGRNIYARFPTSPDNPNHSEPLTLTGLGPKGVTERVEDYRQWAAGGHAMRWPKSIPMKILLREGQPPDMGAVQAAFDATMHDVPHGRIIYSAESLFSGDDSAIGLVSALKDHFEKIHGICYLRPRAGGLISEFQQRLAQTNAVLFFSDDIFRSLDQLTFRDAEYLSRWRDLLARDRLELAVYDRHSMKDGDIVSDFCHRLDLDVAKARKIRINQSFSAEAAAILAALSHFGDVPRDNPYFTRNKAFFNVLMYQFGSGRLGLTDGFADRLFAANESALDWLDKLCGRAYTRLRSKSSHEIDRSEDLFDICRATLPVACGFLQVHGGKAFKRLPQDVDGFARALCNILCQPNPFPKRRLPETFDAAQYFLLNPDIARTRVKAKSHFLAHGCFEGRFY